MIKIDYEKFCDLDKNEIKEYYCKTNEILKTLEKKEEMLDWFDTSSMISVSELKKIKDLSKMVRAKADLLIVIGIGGSYLGAKAVIDACQIPFEKSKPEIVFAGFDLSVEYLENLGKYMLGKSTYVNVISKSGGTIEPNMAFSYLSNILKKNYKDYKDRIIITTDEKSGNLRKLVSEQNFQSLVVPNNIGGRFSVLTSVGLFPIAVAGIDIDTILQGYKNGKKSIKQAVDFAICRDILYKKSFCVEAVTMYESKLNSLACWYQQLFAESQGKNGKGILPMTNIYTTNLHSLGQYFQDGKKIVFETIIKLNTANNLKVDKLKMESVNNAVLNCVADAHKKGGTPSIIIDIENFDLKTLGEFIYFCFIACSVGACLLEVNPFDQPGVEVYKKLLKENLEKLGK